MLVVARAHTLNTYLRKLESWDQYGGMCVFMGSISMLYDDDGGGRRSVRGDTQLVV